MSEATDPLAVLQGAMSDLGAGRHEAVIVALARLPDEGGPMGRGLVLVARGLALEAEGRADEAGRLLEQAFGLGPALPAVALRALAGSFRRSGRRILAHHAFLMLELLEPGALDEAVLDLPPAERARYAPWAMRASWWARADDLYGLAPFKSALRERIGAESGALTLAGLRGRQGARRATRRRLTPLIDHAREVGIDYEEIISAGPVRSVPARIFGQPQRATEERRARALFACVLADVVVSARSGILLAGERALMDVQGDELARRPVDLTVDPIVAAVDGPEVILLEPADRAALPVAPEALWLGGVHSPAYGHWIMEFLPKVWAFMGRAGFERVPLLVDARMPAQHLEAVRLFAGDTNPLIVLEGHEAIRVERLWVASALAYLPVGPLPAPPGPRTRNGFDDEGFRRLLERVRPTLTELEAEPGPARLHLARKPSQHRRLANAAEVEAALAAAGFVTYDFAELTFREQLRLIRGAEHVIGPSGSALLTCVFGRPGLHVGILLPPYLGDIGWLTQASRAVDVELTAIVGEVVSEHPRYRWMSQYRVDPALLAAYLEDPSRADLAEAEGHDPELARPDVRVSP